MSNSTNVVKSDRRSWIVMVTLATGFVGSYFCARLALRSLELATWARVVVAVLPAVAFAVFLLALINGIRKMDELERRIQLEALAVAFPLTWILLLTLGLLELAIELPAQDWSYRHLWAMIPILYLLGLVIARRRYS